MTAIDSTVSSLRYVDRPAYVQRVVRASNGQFTAEEIEKREEESDRARIQQAVTVEKLMAGEGTYLGSSRGNTVFWDPDGNAQAIEQVRSARIEHYSRSPDHKFEIEAVNVSSLVVKQQSITAGHLKDISYYSNYLQNEVAAAGTAKANFVFTGAWGSDHVTHNISEYIGWLDQAAQGKFID